MIQKEFVQKDRPSSILITIVMDDKNNVEDEHSNIENMTPEELEKWIELRVEHSDEKHLILLLSHVCHE